MCAVEKVIKNQGQSIVNSKVPFARDHGAIVEGVRGRGLEEVHTRLVLGQHTVKVTL
jgi:hypothetical protein